MFNYFYKQLKHCIFTPTLKQQNKIFIAKNLKSYNLPSLSTLQSLMGGNFFMKNLILDFEWNILIKVLRLLVLIIISY